MSSNKNDMLIKEVRESMVLGQNAEKNMWPTSISLLMIVKHILCRPYGS